MAVGPGEYDDLCTYVMEEAKAHAAVVIVLGGARGHGFSVQASSLEATSDLPRLLRIMADSIERDTTQ